MGTAHQSKSVGWAPPTNPNPWAGHRPTPKALYNIAQGQRSGAAAKRHPGLRRREKTSTPKGSHPPASLVEPFQGSGVGWHRHPGCAAPRRPRAMLSNRFAVDPPEAGCPWLSGRSFRGVPQLAEMPIDFPVARSHCLPQTVRESKTRKQCHTKPELATKHGHPARRLYRLPRDARSSASCRREDVGWAPPTNPNREANRENGLRSVGGAHPAGLPRCPLHQPIDYRFRCTVFTPGVLVVSISIG